MKIFENENKFYVEMTEKILNDYYEFNEYQKEMMETLKIFHNLCINNGITYYLAYGSLLGAYRHRGQIPWDYDIDVWVPFEQSKKLMSVLDSKLPDEYHYTTRFKDKNYRTYILKLCPKKYDPEILHVDVFWLFGANNDTKKSKKDEKLKRKYRKAMLYKYCPMKYFGVTSRLLKIYPTIQKIKASLYPKIYLEYIFKRMTSIRLEDSMFCTDCEMEGCVDSKLFGNPKIITLSNGDELCVPQQSEELLKILYGDYMKEPSISSKMEEFNNSLKRIRALAKNR